VFGIGLNLLDLKEIPVGNLLPAIGVAPLLVAVLTVLGIGL